MLKQLKKLNENLEKNWTYVLKVIFTLSVFFLYRVFIKSVGYDFLQVFNLIFIMAGILVYTLDKLLSPVIIFLEIIFEPNRSLPKKIRIKSVLTSVFIGASILSVIMYYITQEYPWASISLILWCLAVYITEFDGDYKTKMISLIIRSIILLLTLLGIISVIHCFVYNDLLNIYLFIFIIVFFIYDLIFEFCDLRKESVKSSS